MLLQNLICIVILFAPMIIASGETAQNEERNGKFASPRGLFSASKWRPWSKSSNSKSDSIQKEELADSSGTGLNDYTPSVNSSSAREGKLFSIFTVVRFANDACTTFDNNNGTCYSAAECKARGGVSNGGCAGGFGVCCIFSYTCGQTTNQNSSYFSNLNNPSSYDGTGSCQLTVNKAYREVCQLKLDFLMFNIAPPDGNDSVCNRDQFIVTGGSRVPSICGLNNDQHMYVDVGLVGNTPITLTVVTSGSGFPRTWRIKVSQIHCDSLSRADNGCLQYYTGVSGTLRTFNYDTTTGRHLSNQDYSICIRTESNFCGIAYSVCNGGVFSITGPNGGSLTTAGTPVGALVGAVSCNSDWLTIPCASDNGRPIQSGGTICQDRLCGDAFASVARPNNNVVISNSRPFRIAVHFDGFEANVPTSVTGVQAQFNNRGFCLSYVQQPCTA